MTVGDFELSAEVTRGHIARPGARVGERVRGAIAATRKAVDCNTNLGIVLMSSPIALAVEAADAGNCSSSAADLGRVWSAPTTTDRDRKQLLRCLIEEVIINTAPEQHRVSLTIRWRGGMLTEHAVSSAPLPAEDPHRRGHRGAARATRRPLRRRHDRRHPQPPRPPLGHRRALHRADRRRRASLPRHPLPPITGRTGRRRAGDDRQGRRAARRRPSTVHRWLRRASSPANRTRPARHGGSASTTSSALASSKTRRPAGSPSRRHATPSACRARPSCSVSSAANSTPSMSATAARKVYESR